MGVEDAVQPARARTKHVIQTDCSRAINAASLRRDRGHSVRPCVDSGRLAAEWQVVSDFVGVPALAGLHTPPTVRPAKAGIPTSDSSCHTLGIELRSDPPGFPSSI